MLDAELQQLHPDLAVWSNSPSILQTGLLDTARKLKQSKPLNPSESLEQLASTLPILHSDASRNHQGSLLIYNPKKYLVSFTTVLLNNSFR